MFASQSYRTGALIRRGRELTLLLSLSTDTMERPCQHTGRKWPSAIQKERAQEQIQLDLNLRLPAIKDVRR